MQDEITGLLPNREGYLIGFADMGDLLRGALPFRYAVVIGARLDDSIIDGIEDAPTLEYLNHYTEINDELNGLAGRISDWLTGRGVENRCIPATVDDRDLDDTFFKTLRYPFSHKMAATRAGIGWIGKTALLVSKRFGPRVRMATVLTNCAFERVGTPITESRCDDCVICVERCPAQAANGILWSPGVDRDEFFDAGRCWKTCRERSLEYIQREVSICGMCVSVCPIGIKRDEDGAGPAPNRRNNDT